MTQTHRIVMINEHEFTRQTQILLLLLVLHIQDHGNTAHSTAHNRSCHRNQIPSGPSELGHSMYSNTYKLTPLRVNPWLWVLRVIHSTAVSTGIRMLDVISAPETSPSFPNEAANANVENRDD